jgi:hypothetical protein
MSNGWIKLHRQLLDHDIWTQESFTRGQAWVDLLLLANHSENSFRVRGNLVFVSRGEVARSEDSLAQRWKWSRNKVRRFISELSEKTAQQIEQQKSPILSKIRIINYNLYQSNDKDDTTDDTTERQQKDTNKNDKKEKKEKKNTIQAFPDVVEALTFAMEKRLDSVHVESWHESRELADWTKANGEKVKNWKLDLVNANKFGSFAKKQTTIDSPKWAISKFKPMDYLND